MVFGVQFQEDLDKERQRATNEFALSSFLSLPALSSSHLAPQWSHALRQLTPVRVGHGEQVLISSSPFSLLPAHWPGLSEVQSILQLLFSLVAGKK